MTCSVRPLAKTFLLRELVAFPFSGLASLRRTFSSFAISAKCCRPPQNRGASVITRLLSSYSNAPTCKCCDAEHTNSCVTCPLDRSFAFPAISLLSLAFHDLPPAFPGLTFAQRRFYKGVGKVKRRCRACYVVRRKGQLFVECDDFPRHKQIQKIPKELIWREEEPWVFRKDPKRCMQESVRLAMLDQQRRDKRDEERKAKLRAKGLPAK